MPRNPGCPDPGEAADTKGTGRGGEAVGSDDGRRPAEIPPKAEGSGKEEEGGKTTVGEDVGLAVPLPKSFPVYLQVQVAQQREELRGGGEAPMSLIPCGMIQGIIQPGKLIYRIVMVLLCILQFGVRSWCFLSSTLHSSLSIYKVFISRPSEGMLCLVRQL